MAVELPLDEESTGPLDVAKAAGYEDGIEPPTTRSNTHHNSDELLDPRPEASNPYSNSSETDIYKQKNPLGYTVTEPTAEEIDEADEVEDREPSVVI